MGKSIKFAVYLFFSLFSGFSQVYPCEIIYPAFSQPAIIKKGGSLNVTFEGKPNMTPFKAVLLNEYFETPALVRSAKMESNYWLINITIPEKTPAELYDLKLTSAGCSAVEERSVKVTDNYKDTFVFIHMYSFIFLIFTLDMKMGKARKYSGGS